ncbi:MAG: hypothetical protein MJ152_00760 [Clostridia bacterium]|nr:hypothetical protein [Clostridia bacterium]
MNNVILTKASVVRNIKDQKFTCKLTTDKRAIISKLAEETLVGLGYSKIEDLSEQAKQNLLSSGLILGNLNNTFINKNKVAVNLFEGEHLTIKTACVGYQNDELKTILEYVKALDNKISFAYSDKFGYLTSDISLIGCGLKLESYIDLSAICSLGKINQVVQNIRHLGYNLQQYDKEIYVLSSTCNLGYTETEILDNFKKMLTELQNLETESAKLLASTSKDEIMDKSFRSLAILGSAYLMNCDELKAHLGTIRLAKNLNFVDADLERINKLSMLSLNGKEYVSQSELIDLATEVRRIIKGE